MNFPSKLVENAVNEIAKLPSIGKKTALRLVLHLLKENELNTELLADALVNLRRNIRYCKECHSISDQEVCSVCKSHHRERELICVVEDTKDVLAIENTNHYRGLYHVLGGILSPIHGIGPDQLNIESLLSRLSLGEVKEIILALPSTMDGETTSFYLAKKIKESGVKISSIARGIPLGSDLEYMDEMTIGRSIVRRIAYE
ncbi:MAG: recombination protein RecR [Opitutaceae bacterium]|nr:recombination protein RecR [Cytophagales bacterium]